MKKIKFILFLYGLVVPAFAQQKGIVFRDFNNWQEVLDASKRENKPIFVDFFTTWCSPCKRLEKEVYPEAQVGDYFNQHYIPVKVQMDKTDKDNNQVKKWYPEIKMLEKRYKIDGYPALLFISGTDKLLNRHDGFISPDKLVEIGINSAKPDHKYIRPGGEYYDAIQSFKAGKLNGLVVVKKTNDLVNDEYLDFPGKKKVIDSLVKTSMAYINTQPIATIYNKDILELICRVGLKSDDPIFKSFYLNTTKINKIIGKAGFGELIVDRSLRGEFMNGELNIDSIYRRVKSKYNTKYAQRATDAAKAIYYYKNKDEENTLKSHLVFIEKYGSIAYLNIAEALGEGRLKESNLIKMAAVHTNSFCFDFVFKSNISDQLKRGANLMKPIVEDAYKTKSWWFSQHADTYANLLYRAGDKDRAIELQKKAIEFGKSHLNTAASNDDLIHYQETLDKMLTGIPTWL